MSKGGRKSASIPLSTTLYLYKSNGEGDLTSASKGEYQKNVGSVMCPMVYTRPDIAFAVGKLAQFLTIPTKCHAGVMKSPLLYLRDTNNLRIRYGPFGTSAKRCLGFSDSDFASDKIDRKSTSGMVFLLGDGPCLMAESQATAVATSTTEAEYVAAAMAAKHAKWKAQFLKDLGYAQYIDGADGKGPMTLFLDNKGVS